MNVLFDVIHARTLFKNLLLVIGTHSSDLLIPSIHQLESDICDERNWPYQCGVLQICLQLDEESTTFPNTIVTTVMELVFHLYFIFIYIYVKKNFYHVLGWGRVGGISYSSATWTGRWEGITGRQGGVIVGVVNVPLTNVCCHLLDTL